MSVSAFRAAAPRSFGLLSLALLAAVAFVVAGDAPIRAQGVDCERLRAVIARGGRGGGNAGRARKLQVELGRTQAQAHQLGCDQGFLFFGGSNPQCPGLKGRIEQLQAAIGQGGGGGQDDLVARYNAYCRGGGAEPPRERGFFESLFGGFQDQPRRPLPDMPQEDEETETEAHGGGQAVCVRTCDGGFFPMGISARHSPDSLKEMCTALCPGAEATVFTRAPHSEIKTAVSLDGKPYMDMPYALKFQKEYSSACSCRPAGKSWAEALANAEEIAGNQRKGDILVTQEKSDELSRPKIDPKANAKLLGAPGTTKVTTGDAGKLAADPPALRGAQEVTGPDGVKRLIRRVGPQN